MPRIDNRADQYVFQDGNALSDGVANFGAAIVQAPAAAAQVRQQQQADAMAQVWKEREYSAQQDRAAQMAAQWQADHDLSVKKAGDEQSYRDASLKSTDEDRKADNARQMAAMFGSGLNNLSARGTDWVNAFANLIRSNRAGGAGRDGSLTENEGWARALSVARAEAGTDPLGAAKPIDPRRVQEIYQGMRQGALPPPPPTPPAPPPADAVQAAQDALERYHKGGWFSAGKGDASPLGSYTPEALQEASRRSGLAVPPGIGSTAAPPPAPAAPPAPSQPPPAVPQAPAAAAPAPAAAPAAMAPQAQQFRSGIVESAKAGVAAARSGDKAGAAKLDEALGAIAYRGRLAGFPPMRIRAMQAEVLREAGLNDGEIAQVLPAGQPAAKP